MSINNACHIHTITDLLPFKAFRGCANLFSEANQVVYSRTYVSSYRFYRNLELHEQTAFIRTKSLLAKPKGSDDD
jgi:hypothetical protein